MNKKAITTVISIVLLLIVVTIAFYSFSGWYTNFTQSVQQKKLQNVNPIEDKVQVTQFKLEDSNYNIYVKSSLSGYEIIQNLKVNGNQCNLTSNNVILGGYQTVVEVTCPTYISNNLNDIAIITKAGVINSKTILN